MTTNKLLQLDGLELALQNAIRSSFLPSNIENESPHFWASTTLKNSVEKAMRSWAVRNKANDNSVNSKIYDPPGSGFKIMFGLQIQLSYKVRFKTNLDLGYGFRKGSFAGTGSLHLSTYNGGLGVGVGRSDMVVDVTAAVNLTVGGKQGIPLQSYSLNYNSPIPMLNDYKYSFSYGQLLTWSSALNQNQFSLDKIQREGMIGFRVFDVNVSSNNDTKRLYMGGGTDMGWTGGVSISTPYMEVGFQDFSGDYLRKGNSKEDDDDLLRKYNKENGINSYDFFHRQTPYQKRLNKASTYIRFNKNGYNTTIDIIGDAWLQNLIHKKIQDFRFEYDFKKIETWGGKSW